MLRLLHTPRHPQKRLIAPGSLTAPAMDEMDDVDAVDKRQ